MAKKAKRKRNERRIEDDWGENFGKWMKKRGKELGQEMEDTGERFGRHMERHGRRMDKEWKDTCFDTLGFTGPLIRGIISIIFIAFGIWMLNLINAYLSNLFVFLLSSFLSSNIQLFFIASIFFGYCSYFSRRYQKFYYLLSPIVAGAKAVFVLWFLVSVV